MASFCGWWRHFLIYPYIGSDVISRRVASLGSTFCRGVGGGCYSGVVFVWVCEVIWAIQT